MNEHRLVHCLLALRPADWSDAERALVERHLTACADCAATARAYARQDRLICGAPRVGLTPAQRGQLLSRIPRERRRHEMRTRLSIALGVTATIATIAAVVMSAHILLPQSSQPAPDTPVSPAPGIAHATTGGVLPTGEVRSFLCPPASSSGKEWQCRENARTLTRTCTPVSSPEPEWACYEDLKYGFAVEYPPSDLEVSIPIDEDSSNGVTILRRHSFMGPGGAFDVDITPMFEPDLVTWMEKMRNATGPGLYPAMAPNATVGGHPAVAFTDDPMTISPMFTVLVSNGTYAYRLWFTLRCDDKEIATIQRFVDSFRFSTEAVPAAIPQAVWENVRRAYTRCEIPAATLSLADFQVDTWSAPSPDGKWTAQVTVALPVISSTTVSNNYYTQLKLFKTDGAEWTIVDEWSEWGLGYTIPSPLHWSRDGKYLYFTNKPVPDGCAVFVNGADLHRVDLDDGSVSEIVPSVGLWLSLSPDETMLAYIGYRDRGLVIRDLSAGTEREIRLDPGKDYQAGHITWSPDGANIVLALAIRPCSTDWADSTSIVRVDVTTLEQVTLVHEDKRLFIPVEWATADQVLLKDKGGDHWLMDATTGQITQR